MNYKIAWQSVPKSFQQGLEQHFQSEVLQADIAKGGFSNSGTFKITLRDHTRLFCKINHPGMTQFAKDSFEIELSNYLQNRVPFGFSPKFLGVIKSEGWIGFALEWVDNEFDSANWLHEGNSEVIQRISMLHQQDPSGLDQFIVQKSWELFFSQNTPFVDSRLFARREKLLDLEANAAAVLKPDSLIHLDLRADNILFSKSRGPLFIDWPYLSFGPGLIDFGFFAVSQAAAQNHGIEAMIKVYEKASQRSFSQLEVLTATTLITGFFACRCFSPNKDGLLNVTNHQLLQFRTALPWLLEQLERLSTSE